MTDEELQEIERVWAAAAHAPWRTEDREKYTKLYAVCPPHLHDAYLLDLSNGDTQFAQNVAAIAKAPEHVSVLLGEVKRLRERIAAIEIEARTYEADANGRVRPWNGHYVKDHYILTEPNGRRTLCWPNAGFMNASDGSDRQWAPCANCTVRRIDLDEALPIVRGERKP